MTTLKASTPRDGRLMIFFIIACGLVMFNILDQNHIKLSTPSQISTIHLCFDTKSSLVISPSSCFFEENIVDGFVPNSLRPMFFQPLLINSAGRDLLVTVKGIGPELASGIIQFREENGSFRNVEDLTLLDGVASVRAKYLATVLTFEEASWETK